jgi:hypothetical protein
MVLRSAAGTPVAADEPFLMGHSNVIVALVGGSADVRQKVERALRALPQSPGLSGHSYAPSQGFLVASGHGDGCREPLRGFGAQS